MTDSILVPVVTLQDDMIRNKDDLERGEQGVVHELQNNVLPDFKPGVVNVERHFCCLNRYSIASFCACYSLGGLIYGIYHIFARGEKDGIIISASFIFLILIFVGMYADQRDFPEELQKDVLWVSGENEARELLAVIKSKNPDLILSFFCKCNLSQGWVREVVEAPTCFDYSPDIQIGNAGKPVLKLNLKLIDLDMKTSDFIEMKKQQAKDQGHGEECLAHFLIYLERTEDIPRFVLIDRNNRGYADRFSYVKFKQKYNLGCGGCYMYQLRKLIEEKNFPLTKVVSVKNVEELLESFPELNETSQVTV